MTYPIQSQHLSKRVQIGIILFVLILHGLIAIGIVNMSSTQPVFVAQPIQVSFIHANSSLHNTATPSDNLPNPPAAPQASQKAAPAPKPAAADKPIKQQSVSKQLTNHKQLTNQQPANQPNPSPKSSDTITPIHKTANPAIDGHAVIKPANQSNASDNVIQNKPIQNNTTQQNSPTINDVNTNTSNVSTSNVPATSPADHTPQSQRTLSDSNQLIQSTQLGDDLANHTQATSQNQAKTASQDNSTNQKTQTNQKAQTSDKTPTSDFAFESSEALWQYKPNLSYDSQLYNPKGDRVSVTFKVDNQGNVKSISFDTGDRQLNKELRRQLMRAKFKPFVRDGVAVSGTVNISLVYH